MHALDILHRCLSTNNNIEQSFCCKSSHQLDKNKYLYLKRSLTEYAKSSPMLQQIAQISDNTYALSDIMGYLPV